MYSPLRRRAPHELLLQTETEAGSAGTPRTGSQAAAAASAPYIAREEIRDRASRLKEKEDHDHSSNNNSNNSRLAAVAVSGDQTAVHGRPQSSPPRMQQQRYEQMEQEDPRLDPVIYRNAAPDWRRLTMKPRKGRRPTASGSRAAAPVGEPVLKQALLSRRLPPVSRSPSPPRRLSPVNSQRLQGPRSSIPSNRGSSNSSKSPLVLADPALRQALLPRPLLPPSYPENKSNKKTTPMPLTYISPAPAVSKPRLPQVNLAPLRSSNEMAEGIKRNEALIDPNKVRVRNSEELFSLLRYKLEEAEKMISESGAVWRKRLEETLIANETRALLVPTAGAKLVHDFKDLMSRRTRKQKQHQQKQQRSAAGNSHRGSSPSPPSQSFATEDGRLFKRQLMPTSHYSSGLTLLKNSAKQVEKTEIIMSFSEPLNMIHELEGRYSKCVKHAFFVAEEAIKESNFAKFCYERHPTSVNMRRLEVVSVRSVRVLLGSIQKVTDICSELQQNYAYLNRRSSTVRAFHYNTITRSPAVGSRASLKYRPRSASAGGGHASRRRREEAFPLTGNRRRPQSAAAPRSRRGVAAAVGERPQSALPRIAEKSNGRDHSPYKEFAVQSHIVQDREWASSFFNDENIHLGSGNQLAGSALAAAVDITEEDAGRSSLPAKSSRSRRAEEPTRSATLGRRGRSRLVKHTRNTRTNVCSECGKKFHHEGKHIPSSSSIDKAELDEMRAQDLEAKIEALENGQLRSFERKQLRQHLAMRQKVESVNCIFDRLFLFLGMCKIMEPKALSSTVSVSRRYVN